MCARGHMLAMVQWWSEDNLKELVPPLFLLWAPGLELRSSGLHMVPFLASSDFVLFFS